VEAGQVEGKIAFVTGAARGQGRAHAVRLAEAGARIIAVDVCRNIPSAPYDLASPADLEETVRLVEAAGGEIAPFEADVRDAAALQHAIDGGTERLRGGIDIVVANAAVSMAYGPIWAATEEQFDETMAINLRGVWQTVRLAVPGMLEHGRGGAIVMTSSYAGLNAIPKAGVYTAAKHGVTGLMRSFAAELAPHRIRVNSLHPGIVLSGMTDNQAHYDVIAGHPNGTREEMRVAGFGLHALPMPWLEPRDISDALLWLVSDQARYVTGVALPVDAGAHIAFKAPSWCENERHDAPPSTMR
jgi:SDR family mycofactocin-dependent oxidoreductase